MPTLAEMNPEELDDESLSIHEVEQNQIVDLPIGPDGQMPREHPGSDFEQNRQKRKFSIKRTKTTTNLRSSNAQKLAAGWRIVNERLKDIEQLEKRNKSQIKYEVDKAFEMAKYLDETNLASRDPATTQAYTSMVQMCMSRLDHLTPFMILQKLEQEKKDLQQLLTVDPTIVKKNSNSVAKILNFVCLENCKYLEASIP